MLCVNSRFLLMPDPVSEVAMIVTCSCLGLWSCSLSECCHRYRREYYMVTYLGMIHELRMASKQDFEVYGLSSAICQLFYEMLNDLKSSRPWTSIYAENWSYQIYACYKFSLLVGRR